MYILFRSTIIRGCIYHFSSMFKYIYFLSRSFYIDDMYSLLNLLVIPFFSIMLYGILSYSSQKTYIYLLFEAIKSLYFASLTTIIKTHMGKRKRSNFNQSKYWLEDSEHFYDKSSDEDTNVNHDSEDAEIPSTLQDTSNESDDGMVEKDSGDESDENSVETESINDEEPPRRRAKRKPQVKPTPVKIFSSKSGRQWTSKEPPKRKVPATNILRQRTGIGRPAADIQTLKEAFRLLITQEMVLLLVKETNRRAHLLLERWSEENPDKKSQWRDTKLEEMWAFIELLLLAGVHRAKNETLDELWSMINGRPIFRATMTKNRFKSLL